MILVHGTTLQRAKRIVDLGPDSKFREPGGYKFEDSFSTYLEKGPFTYLPPEEYARLKTLQCPDEGGPVILAMDVPEEVVHAAIDDALPLSEGYVFFYRSQGLEELQNAWPSIRPTCVIRSI